MKTTKDLVLAQLRKEKIKLWLPPYHHGGGGGKRGGDSVGGGEIEDGDEALNELAESLKKKLMLDYDSKNCGADATGDEIFSALGELRNHAVEKWKERNSIDVRILTSGLAAANISEGDGGGDAAANARAEAAEAAEAAFSRASWGDEVSILKGADARSGGAADEKALRLRVTNLSPTLTVDKLSLDIRHALNAETVRFIWRGTNLSSSSPSPSSINSAGGEVETLRNMLEATGIGGKGGGGNRKRKGELLCLVSGAGGSPAAAGAAPSATERTDRSVVRSVRDAARAIQNSPRGSRFEVTDQGGNLVPMGQSDAAAFLAALGLHRIGRSRMERQGHDADGIASDSGTDGEDGGGRDVASGLVFLLEADAEWNNSPALEGWKDKVDNYGLLQLDIAWCYLLLESLDGLDDAVRRLDIAERALKKQVHSNFVTLALAQAEMNNPIPPLCAIFVRLFLLQGVANKIFLRQSCDAANASAANDAAEERLGWARLLCRRLRTSCRPEAVEALCRAYIVDPPVAVAALRRSDGDPDAAGNLIIQDRDEEGRAARKRRRQRDAGRCANGTDFVDLDLIPALSGMLGFGGGNGLGNAALESEQSTGTLIVIGLLRLSDNSIDRSLELYNSNGAEQVMEQVARLDEVSGRRKRRSTRSKKPTQHEVQDMDLTVLVSMGVEEARAREALKATGNVESALLWLSKDDGNNAKANAKIGDSDTALAGEGHFGDEADGSMDGEGDDNDDKDSDLEGNERMDDAHELLERELGNALGADSRQLLEREWLGVDLQGEWDLIEKYT